MSSWIVDGSANRFHKTYLKGFLDISGGNVYIRNGHFYINQGDISCNGNLIIQNDISCNGSISFQDNLMVQVPQQLILQNHQVIYKQILNII